MANPEAIYNSFRHLAIERAKPPPTAEQLAAIEEVLGAKLPALFSNYLSAANGGSLDGYFVEVPMGNGDAERISFGMLFSADPGDFCDETLIGEIRSEREHKEIPVGVLPFARDGGGCVVYLDLSSEGKGRVVAFIQGLPEWTGLRTESAFIELAPSFGAYIDSLRVDQDNILDALANHASELRHVEATEQFLDIALPGWREDQKLAIAVAKARSRIAGIA